MIKVKNEVDLRLFSFTLDFLGYIPRFHLNIEIDFLTNAKKDQVYMLLFTKTNQFNLDELIHFEEEYLGFIIMPASFLLNCKNTEELHSYVG